MDQQAEQEFDFNLRDYIQIFVNRKWIILLSFLLVFFSVFIYTNLQTPLYRASLVFRVEPRMVLPSKVVFPTAEAFTKHNLSDYLRQVVSTPVIEMVAKKKGWIRDGMTPAEIVRIVNGLNNRTYARETGKGNMIRVYCSSKDPKEAADTVNTIFEVFKKANVEQRNQQIRKVREFVEDTLKKVETKLKCDEERLKELTMQGSVGTGSHIIDEINKMEAKRTDLLTKFTEKHPDVISVTEEIAGLKEALKNLPKEEFEYRILERDIEINEKLYNSLKQRLQEVKIKEVEKIDNVFLVDPATPPKRPYYPDKKKNYFIGTVLGIAFGIALAFMAEQLDTSIRRVEDIENFLKVSVLGMVPYCAAVDSERSKYGIFKKVFRRHPRERKKERSGLENIIALEQGSDPRFMEAMRILSVNMQMRFGGGDKIKSKIIMITSCSPQDGKSLIASNLAIVMSQMGYKVMLLDTDTRRPTIHKNFGFENRENGLTDILTGETDIDSAVKTATDLMLAATDADIVMNNPWLNNLHIITAGASFPNPANLFNSEKMSDTLNILKSRYDIVLVDSPPILTVSEPSIVGPRMDEILLVFRAGYTSRLILNRAKNQIESVKGKGTLSGVIVNSVTPETGRYGYYGYYEKYYSDYYTAGRDKSQRTDNGGRGNV